MALSQMSYLLSFFITLISVPCSTCDVIVSSNASCADSSRTLDVCLTLNEYLGSKNESDFNMIFLDGRHELDVDFIMSDLVDVSLRADSNASVSIDCKGQTRFLFINVSRLIIENISFTSCGISSIKIDDPLPGISLYNLDQAELINVTITNSASGALYIYGSNITITDITVLNNYYIDMNGTFSGLMVENSTLLLQGNNTFAHNGAPIVDGINSSCRLYYQDFFRRLYYGSDTTEAVFLALNTHLIVDGTLIVMNNTSPSGIMIVQYGTVEITGEANFTDNQACLSGALFLYRLSSTGLLSGNFLFSKNLASYPIYNAVAGFRIDTSTVEINGTILFFANVGDVSSFLINNSSVSLLGGYFSSQNDGYTVFLALSSVFVTNGAIYFNHDIADRGIFNGNDSFITTNGSVTFANNQGDLSSVLVSSCLVDFNGVTIFTANRGVLYSVTSNVTFSGRLMSTRNYGSGMVVLSSILMLDGEYTFASNDVKTGNGAGIQASLSFVFLAGNGTFINNIARNGGAVYLLTNSRVRFGSGSILTFEDNIAVGVGGVFCVADTVSYAECSNSGGFSSLAQPTSCFFDFESYAVTTPLLRFYNNTAEDGGSVLHGGKLDKCSLGNGLSPLDVFQEQAFFDDRNSLPVISSAPFRLCFCSNGTAQCSSKDSSMDLTVVKGKLFSVSVIAFSQTGNSTSGIVRSYLGSLSASNSLSGQVQRLKNRCTKLSYRVRSETSEEVLFIYGDGPCRDVGDAVQTVRLTFADCPEGFSLHSGDCICDERLRMYTNSCEIDTGIIKKNRINFWAGPYFNNGTYLGLITYPYCLFHYCTFTPAEFKLSDPNSQCSNNHAGMLCGGCEENYSLILGGYRCMDCSDNSFLALLLLFAVLGIALVAVLFLLQLTVASGTIHGLIFFANIVNSSSSVYFPPDRPILIIAWLNLNFGIDSCFHDKMDQLAMTAWQFAFPIYLWFLVGMIIILSHYSIKFSKIFVNSDPVAVLATIILLSYTKMWQNIVSIFSIASLHYPQNETRAVWLHDGNVELFTEHTPGFWYILFVVALVLLLFLFLPYTVILLTAPLIQKYSNILSRMNLTPFINAYYVPYKSNSRYWTGFGLLLRCVITTLIGATEELSINLLAISTLSILLLTIIGVSHGIYTNPWLDVLEIVSLLNLGVFTVATYHNRATDGNQTVLAYLSSVVALLILLTIITVHIIKQIRGYAWFERGVEKTKKSMMSLKQYTKREKANSMIQNEVTTQEVTVQFCENRVYNYALRESLLEDSV